MHEGPKSVVSDPDAAVAKAEFSSPDEERG